MFAIIDVETTGGSATRDRIIEVAIIIHDGLSVVNKWESLINPEIYIPPFITSLTGITNDMVRNAPKFYEVAKQIVELTKDQIFVAHNARFDYSFFQEEFNRLGYRYQRKMLCTVKISRKLLPRLPRHNLDTLLTHFNIVIPPNQRHRAMGDTEATAKIFDYFIKNDPNRHIESLLNGGVRAAKLPPNITLDILHGLPEKCGVYYFHNEQGVVTYVGKSINVKKRVMDHFANKADKASQMCSTAHDISFELTGSELVALILEEHEIKRLQPTYNVANRKQRLPYGIFGFENHEGYQCFIGDLVENHPKMTPLETYQKQADATNILQLCVKEFELCARLAGVDGRKGACFFHPLGKCKGACVGEEPMELYNFRAGKAVKYITEDFAHDMIILDKGRDSKEMSVVLVEGGRYKGFGYIEKNERLEETDLMLAVKSHPHTSDLAKIINGHIRSAVGLKIIKI